MAMAAAAKSPKELVGCGKCGRNKKRMSYFANVSICIYNCTHTRNTHIHTYIYICIYIYIYYTYVKVHTNHTSRRIYTAACWDRRVQYRCGRYIRTYVVCIEN